MWCYIEISEHTLNMPTQIPGMVCYVQDSSVIRSHSKNCDWLIISSTEMRQLCHGIWCILTWRTAVGEAEVQVSADMPSPITSQQRCLARNAISCICSEVAELQRVNRESINYSRFRWNLPPPKKDLQRLNAFILSQYIHWSFPQQGSSTPIAHMVSHF